MDSIIQVLGWLASIGSLVCFVLVVVKMFQHNQTTLGVVCIVGVFCCIGGLIAFVFGWMKSKEWNITNIMIIWTICFIISIIGGAMAPMDVSKFMPK